MSTGYPPLDNPRMVQILRHAGVKVVSVAPHRVTIVPLMEDGQDPLTKLILHLEPTAARGAEHMPSVEEAIEMGLVYGGPRRSAQFDRPWKETDYGSLMMPGDGED